MIICDGCSQSLQFQRIPCPFLISEALDYMWREDTDIRASYNQTDKKTHVVNKQATPQNLKKNSLKLSPESPDMSRF